MTGSSASFATPPISVTTGTHAASEEFADERAGALYDSTYRCADAGQVELAAGAGRIVACRSVPSST